MPQTQINLVSLSYVILRMSLDSGPRIWFGYFLVYFPKLKGWGEGSFLELISQEIAGIFKLSVGAANY
jgi:hypothetical protein